MDINYWGTAKFLGPQLWRTKLFLIHFASLVRDACQEYLIKADFLLEWLRFDPLRSVKILYCWVFLIDFCLKAHRLSLGNTDRLRKVPGFQM